MMKQSIETTREPGLSIFASSEIVQVSRKNLPRLLFYNAKPMTGSGVEASSIGAIAADTLRRDEPLSRCRHQARPAGHFLTERIMVNGGVEDRHAGHIAQRPKKGRAGLVMAWATVNPNRQTRKKRRSDARPVDHFGYKTRLAVNLLRPFNDQRLSAVKTATIRVSN